MASITEQVTNEILQRLERLENPSRNDLNRIKIQVCKEHRAPIVPANTQLLKAFRSHSSKYPPILVTKQVRARSGVTTVAVMPKPWACPHGKCTYCPGGPDVGVPRAYTGKEPAVMRALEADYDPVLQVSSRLAQLDGMGHVVDKVELILVGGTFTFLPEKYQEEFIQHCLDTLNETSSRSLEDAKQIAETARVKNVGITVETRPDWARRQHVDHILTLGVTRVEIGVQTLYDDVYERIHRDHSVTDVIQATQTLKDSCLKVGYHMMLGLPGCDPKRDLEALHRTFHDGQFKPDMLKIYPCLVTPGTQLYEEWKAGKYKPYTTMEAAKLIVEIKQFIPRWTRIMRIQREIPRTGIADGVVHGNLRQLVERELEQQNIHCHCIRCREIGQYEANNDELIHLENVEVSSIRYEASQGEEVFISYEDSKHDILVGYVRLRIPSSHSHRPEIEHDHVALIRELHVLGQTVPVGSHLNGAYQHQGYGRKLLAQAERLACEEYDRDKMIVISALGTKQYYAKLGYEKDGPYMSKGLRRENN